ncbi:MAG: ATP-binding cassette domain-containing protein [Dehalococcoidia bacterium]
MSPVVEVEDLHKTYPDGAEALRGISFNVEQGEFFGFLGPNGAGKSTTIKILITLLAATAGRARVFGYDINADPDTIRVLIGYTAQEVGVDDELSGRENLMLQGQLYHMDRGLLRRRIDELLELVDLEADADRMAGSYSGGMRKRLDLATGLIHRPQLLFLDEPTTGLDPQNRAGIWSYLEDLNKREGLTLFLTTHYLEEADKLCDRLAIIDHGRIIASGSPTELKAELGGDVISLAFRGDETQTSAQRTRAAEVLRPLQFVGAINQDDGKLVLTAHEGGRALPKILRALDEAEIYVDDLTLTSPTLDDVFLKYTGERIREDAPVQNWRNQRMMFMRPGPGRPRRG